MTQHPAEGERLHLQGRGPGTSRTARVMTPSALGPCNVRLCCSFHSAKLPSPTPHQTSCNPRLALLTRAREALSTLRHHLHAVLHWTLNLAGFPHAPIWSFPTSDFPHMHRQGLNSAPAQGCRCRAEISALKNQSLLRRCSGYVGTLLPHIVFAAARRCHCLKCSSCASALSSGALGIGAGPSVRALGLGAGPSASTPSLVSSSRSGSPSH